MLIWGPDLSLEWFVLTADVVEKWSATYSLWVGYSPWTRCVQLMEPGALSMDFPHAAVGSG